MKDARQNEQQILLNLLLQKQERLNIHYIRSTDIIYKAFDILNIIFGAVVLVINLLYMLGVSGQLQANMSNKVTAYTTLQAGQVAAIKNSLYAVGIMSVLVLISLLLHKVKLAAARLSAGAVATVVLAITYTNRLSNAVQGGDYTALLWRHYLPLFCYLVTLITVTVFALKQTYKDKKGCEKIAAELYSRFSSSAANIREEQWNEMLQEYSEQKAKSIAQKQQKKSRKKGRGDQSENDPLSPQ